MRLRALSLFTAVVFSLLPAAALSATAEANRPNVVIVFTDDQGYQDVGCFGSPDIETPHLDRVAEEGMRLTDFYVSQAVCSASRASLLTGCYNVRVGILGALGPRSRHGIHEDELTLGDLVKNRGYATAVYGKWHLGHHPEFLPLRHGFDEYFGIPYSNDMWPHHPTAGKRFPALPMIEGERIVNEEVTPEDQTMFTTWFTERTVRFIEQHRDQPFLVYLAHPMPHVPLYVSDKFAGKSERGLYGDVIMEIDWSVGQILETLERLGLDENTLVIFTSDNGPWLSYGTHGGSALPLREGKGTTFDGGFRVPCIMRWPARIPPGTVCNELAATIDILPTLAEILDVALPEDRIIDGKSILPLIEGRPGAKSPHEFYALYHGRELQAIRSGRWKLHFPHAYRTLAGREGRDDGFPVPYSTARTGLELYDMDNDVGETEDVAEQHPEIVARLKGYAEQMRDDLGDSATKRKGRNLRAPGRLAN